MKHFPLLSLLLLSTLLFAQDDCGSEQSEIWDGSPDPSWYTSNTSASTYTICTAEQLAGLAELVNEGTNFSGKNIKLSANIMLNDITNWQNWATNPPVHSWTPIGNSGDNRFRGNFDGNGKIISGLYINSTASYQGLFGYTENANISKLGLVGFYVKGGGYAGGISGYGYGTITNSYAIGIGGISSGPTTIVNSYFAGIEMGIYYGFNGSSIPKTTAEMQGSRFPEILQMYAGVLNVNSDNNYMGWKFNENSYPSFSSEKAFISAPASYFARGTGAATNPYIIENKTHLENLAILVNSGLEIFQNRHIRLDNDIKLNDTTGWKNWDNTTTGLEHWMPIRNFRGTFDGNNKVISGLYINSIADDQGLFGSTSEASISSLGLVSFYVKGNNYVGGIISDGANAIINSYAVGNVEGNDYVGGLSGSLSAIPIGSGRVTNSYFIGNVSGNRYVGGISGGRGTVTNSYVIGNVSGAMPSYTGGIIGESGTVTNSFYNSDYSTGSSSRGIPKTTTEMKDNKFYKLLQVYAEVQNANNTNNNYTDWIYNNDNNNAGYPSISNTKAVLNTTSYFASGVGAATNPYIVMNKEQLENLAILVNSGKTFQGESFQGEYIKLGADIILNDTTTNGGWEMWAYVSPGLEQWTPIGVDFDNSFRGNFDGNGKIISGLYINNNNDYQGLFGNVGSLGGGISNLGLVGFYVKGGNYTGGIMGSIGGTIANSYAIGNVSGANRVGGISGDGTVTNSYFVGEVTGTGSNVGGVSGSGTITHSFYNSDYPTGSNSRGTPKNTSEIQSTAFYELLQEYASEQNANNGNYMGWKYNENGYPSFSGIKPVKLAEEACLAEGKVWESNACRNKTDAETCTEAGNTWVSGLCKTFAQLAEEACLAEGKIWKDNSCEGSTSTLPQIANLNIRVKAIGNHIILENLPQNAKVEVYNLQGKRIYFANPVNPLIGGIGVQTKGIYIVKINNQIFRIPVR